MFNGILQPMHLLLILAIVLIIFGAGKLPEVGKSLGTGIREFRASVSDLSATEGSGSASKPPVAPSPVAPIAAEEYPPADALARRDTHALH